MHVGERMNVILDVLLISRNKIFFNILRLYLFIYHFICSNITHTHVQKVTHNLLIKTHISYLQ